MTERYPTPTTPDRYAFDVLIDGESVGIDVVRNVLEIDVDERVNAHAVAQLLVNNWIPSERTVRFSDDGPFQPGASIEIRAGYHSELRSVFSGIVTGLEASFTASSIPTLTVDARSKSILLAAGVRARSFENVSDVDVVARIASDHGLSAEVDEALSYETLFEPTRTDWERVVARATRYGWVAYVRDDVLRLGPPAPAEEPITLTHGKNLLEIRLREDLRNRTDPVTINVWDPTGQESLESESSADSEGPDTGSRPTLTAAIAELTSDRVDTVAGSPASGDQAAADLLSAGRARVEALHHINGRGATVGVPDLRIDSWVRIEAGGQRLGGTHYVSQVRHRIGRGGYTTEFTLGLERPLRPAAHPANPAGLTLAVVESLDDPSGWGRVKVVFPWLGDDVLAVWARLALLDAGSDFGTLFVPEVGQEVVVGFVGADEPVVLGALWNGQHAPPEQIDPEANDVRSIVTKSGHRLRFDDAGQTVEVASSDGRSVLLDDANQSITLGEAGGSSIVIDSSGITLTAASGNITIKADSGDIDISGIALKGSATAPSKIESSATLDISASATLGLKGALVNIN